MRKTSYNDDDQHLDEPTSQTTRRFPRSTDRLNESYYPDEHPEVPRVRRASRYINTTPSTNKLNETTKRAQLARRQAENEVAQLAENETFTSSPQNNEIMVPQRRRTNIVKHSPAGRYKRERRKQIHARRTFADQVRQISHNKILLIMIATAALLLLCMPILNSLAQGNSPFTVTGNNSPGSKATEPGKTGIQPTDPHHIIIEPAETEHPAPPVYATAAYLLNADTGQTLYARNPFMHLPVMSTTKLMTALLTIEHGNLDQKITINDAMNKDINDLSADSSVMNVKKGETYTLRELLYGLMLVSGNDAAIVIADTLEGNIPNFVTQMNQRAAALGLHDTHYRNPHGLLDPDHYSSAHDLAILARYALANPQLHQITGTREYRIPATKEHPEHILDNTDQFLWWYPGVDGGKTGWDADSNFVQVISCTRNNHHLIGVVIHTRDWWTDMRDLMNWGFNSFTWISPRDINANDHAIPFAVDWNYFDRDNKENTIPTDNNGRYYIYTGYAISGQIMSYFDKNTGLKKFGYPIGQPQAESDNVSSQKFEHGTIQCNLKTKQCTLHA